MDITIDKNSRTIKIIPNVKFRDFHVEKFTKYFHIRYEHEKKEKGLTIISGRAIIFKDFGGRKYYPNKINIESITETEIKLSYN